MLVSLRRLARLGWAALALALALSSLPVRPAAAHPSRDQITHTVQGGENLYRIGLQYGVSWTDIMEANHLASSTIYAGQVLIIPVHGSVSDVPPAGPPDPAPTQVGPAPTPSGQSTTYVVQPGDILSRIAQRYGVTVSQIAAANSIANPSLIYAGQVLVIPAGGSDAGASNGDGTDNSSPGDPPPPLIGNKEIQVNLSTQRMYVYQDGALLWDWVVSTGEPGRETVPGNFSVLNKIPNAYGATWDLWMPNWLGIYWAGSLQNGIHALPILSDGSRLWAGLLGQRVSFGCVILGISEAQTLYDWAEVGTPVNITY